jgi:hypothetical protein
LRDLFLVQEYNEYGIYGMRFFVVSPNWQCFDSGLHFEFDVLLSVFPAGRRVACRVCGRSAAGQGRQGAPSASDGPHVILFVAAQLVFARSLKPDLLWVPIAEKCYAKLYDGEISCMQRDWLLIFLSLLFLARLRQHYWWPGTRKVRPTCADRCV